MEISVVVPVYNVFHYLERCVKSLENQTKKIDQIILVDDGSTDESGALCDQLEKKYDNIDVIHKENGGLSSARNAGIDIAKGEYIGFIDSDDYVDAHMYEHLYKAMVKSGKDIACCGRYLIGEDSHITVEFTLDKEYSYSTQEAISAILLLEKIDVSACDKLYKKKMFANIRYPEGKISEDAAIIFDIVSNSNGIVHVGKPYYYYWFRSGSITKSKYFAKKYDIINNLKKTGQFIIVNYPKLIKEYKIYSTITCAGLILNMWEDKESKAKYPLHYKEYRQRFNQGFWYTVLSKEIRLKMKIRIIAIKMHFIGLFYLMKRLYVLFCK